MIIDFLNEMGMSVVELKDDKPVLNSERTIKLEYDYDINEFTGWHATIAMTIELLKPYVSSIRIREKSGKLWFAYRMLEESDENLRLVGLVVDHAAEWSIDKCVKCAKPSAIRKLPRRSEHLVPICDECLVIETLESETVD
jgi:hypothetical protein